MSSALVCPDGSYLKVLSYQSSGYGVLACYSTANSAYVGIPIAQDIGPIGNDPIDYGQLGQVWAFSFMSVVLLGFFGSAVGLFFQGIKKWW